MKESIHKYFKLGTLQWMSFPNSAPLDALTAIARDDFFDAVEIKSYGAEKEQAKAILEAAGQKTGLIGTNGAVIGAAQRQAEPERAGRK